MTMILCERGHVNFVNHICLPDVFLRPAGTRRQLSSFIRDWDRLGNVLDTTPQRGKELSHGLRRFGEGIRPSTP